MGQAILTLVIDGTVALLLLVTIGYCWKLNKRIRILQDSKSELAEVIRQFDESTVRATHSINEIYEASQRIADNIQHKLDKANYLADDLQFMIEKGGKVADKMEGELSVARKKASPSRSPSPRNEQESAPARKDDGLAAIAKPARTKRPVKGGDRKKSSLSSLENMLNKAASRDVESGAEADSANAAPARRRAGGRVRSKAEKELFDALKATSNEV